MNIFSRIAIGTANWVREYNGAKVPEKDIEKILGMAQCSGINTLDCATAYGWDWTQANSYFNKIVKVRKGDDIESVMAAQPYVVMLHEQNESDDIEWLFEKLEKNDDWTGEIGISTYNPENIEKYMFNVIQVPYSLYDRRFEHLFLDWKWNDIEIHVRSVFLRGRIIADGIPAEECIKFCLANPYIDKIIIGADSFDQFRRNLDFIFKWNNLEKKDDKLLDTRQWKEQQ